MKKPFFNNLLLAICIAISPLSHAADTNAIDSAGQSEVELDYIDVMHYLVQQMQDIVVAIMYEDYETLGDVAENIAYHRGPSSDKRMALLHKLGMESLTFRLHQDKVRQNALNLMEQAKKHDRIEVLRSYAQLAQACTDCHASYRARIRGMKAQEFSPNLFEK